MLRTALVLVGLALCCSWAAAQGTAGPSKHDWPGYRGPGDDFVAPFEGRLIEDLTQARLVWSSEEKNLGWAKYPISGWGGVGAKPGAGLPGGNGSPIVYDGKVYFAGFRPSGQVVDKGKLETGRAKHGDKYRTDFYLIEAQDVVVAMDAATGKTVWKQVLDGGLNRPTIKRSGWGVTPAGYDGRIFAMTTMGVANAFDAKTGKVLWSTAVDTAAEASAQDRKRALESQKTNGGSDAMNAGLTVIGGVLLAPDFRDGIAALDPKTGQRLWYKPDIRAGRSVPAIFRHEGKEYIVVGSQKGELRLLEPRSGEELWKAGGLSPLPLTLTVSGQHVFVLAPTEPDRKGWGHWAAYKMTPQKAELAWKTPYEAQHAPDAGPMHIVVARNGVVYLGMTIFGPTALVDQATGRTVHLEEKLGNLVACIWGDRLVIRSESDHDSPWRWFSLDPKGFREFGTGWKPKYLAGYTTPVITPFADGFIFQRSEEDGGTIRCYDLRAK